MSKEYRIDGTCGSCGSRQLKQTVGTPFPRLRATVRFLFGMPNIVCEDCGNST